MPLAGAGMSDDEDEMGDFIVDEEPGEGGGAARAQARRRRRKALQGAMPGISGAMMEVSMHTPTHELHCPSDAHTHTLCGTRAALQGPAPELISTMRTRSALTALTPGHRLFGFTLPHNLAGPPVHPLCRGSDVASWLRLTIALMLVHVQEAADIFGDVGALMEMYDMARTQRAGEEGDEHGGAEGKRVCVYVHREVCKVACLLLGMNDMACSQQVGEDRGGCVLRRTGCSVQQAGRETDSTQK